MTKITHYWFNGKIVCGAHKMSRNSRDITRVTCPSCLKGR